MHASGAAGKRGASLLNSGLEDSLTGSVCSQKEGLQSRSAIGSDKDTLELRGFFAAFGLAVKQGLESVQGTAVQDSWFPSFGSRRQS